VVQKSKKSTNNQVVRELARTRDSVFARFPLLFTLLVAFGFSATLYGFFGIIDKISLLASNPFIALLTGVLILIFTGKLYKKLG